MLILHTLLKNYAIKLISSYFLWYFCHIQICNDDCWVICMLLSNVKSLFDYVRRRSDIASLCTRSERQERQADEAQPEAQHACKPKPGAEIPFYCRGGQYMVKFQRVIPGGGGGRCVTRAQQPI